MEANKAVIALAGVMATAVLPLLSRGDLGTLEPEEWINVAIASVGAGSVYMASNLEGGVWAYTKAIFAAVSAALMLLVSFLGDQQVVANEWVQVAVVFIATVGVALKSNDSAEPEGRHRAEDA